MNIHIHSMTTTTTHPLHCIVYIKFEIFLFVILVLLF